MDIGNKHTLVSILMPAYNCEKFIRTAIDSVINQTYTNWELLIADDCSKDNTRAIIETYTDKRIKLYHNETNLGYLKTSNKLFALSTGSYIAFQDADDYSDVKRIATQFNFLQNNSDVYVCGCNLLFVSETGEQLYCSNYENTVNAIKLSIATGDFSFSPNTYLLKREVVEDIGFYHVYFDRIGAEDYYWTTLIISKFNLVNLPTAMYYYRLNPVSITGNLSDNPRKMFSADMVKHLYLQRLQTGTDDLEQNNIASVEQRMASLVTPFLNNQSHYFHTLAKRSFYAGKKKQATNFMIKSIKLKPLNTQLYKDLLYFLRNKAE